MFSYTKTFDRFVSPPTLKITQMTKISGTNTTCQFEEHNPLHPVTIRGKYAVTSYIPLIKGVCTTLLRYQGLMSILVEFMLTE